MASRRSFFKVVCLSLFVLILGRRKEPVPTKLQFHRTLKWSGKVVMVSNPTHIKDKTHWVKLSPIERAGK